MECGRSGKRVISKLLIANRGEIAVRIIRTCRDLDVSPVVVYSEPDAGARHVALADESIAIPGRTPADTYLNRPAMIDAARASGAEAVHPGYGFLAENAAFAEDVVASGLKWVGPPPAAVAALGDKISARRMASRAGIPVVPGLLEPVGSAEEVRAFGDEHGYPLVIKAAAGGGGRGLKVTFAPEDVAASVESARREAGAYFGSEEVYVERYLDAPKHLEVQILAAPGRPALWLGVRDCSLQRRHQKLIEESPPATRADRADEMGAAAAAFAQSIGYTNAGTVEFLVDESGDFYFLEVNARLQVEHTVTEEIFDIDLVACQLSIASEDELGLAQSDLVPRGHAVECRINAEDSVHFVPAPGRLDRFELPSGPGVRVDTGYITGDAVPAEYDSLIAKVVTHGNDRATALRRMRRALNEFEVEGVPTTVPAHLQLLDNDDFRRGTHTTLTLMNALPDSGTGPQPRAQLAATGRARLWNPAMGRAARSIMPAHNRELSAPLQGTVLEVRVVPGDPVEAGDVLVVLEAMKMETVLTAPFTGKVIDVPVTPGQTVAAGIVLVIIEPVL